MFSPVSAAVAVFAGFVLIAAPACSQNVEERASVCPAGYEALSDNAPEAAIAAFEACLQERQYDWPVEAELRLRLGSAHLAEGHGREALIAFNQIFALVEDRGGDTDNPPLRRNRAVAYLQLDRPRDAVADLRVAVSREPRDAFNHILLGSAYMDLDRHAEAAEAFDAAVRLEPESEGGWIGRSAAFVELGLTAQAVEDAQEAVAIAPDDADALNALCWALVKDERAAQGLDLCEAAAAADPESGAIVHSLAAALEQVGQTRRARELYARAFELSPDNETIAEDYARTRG